ncbi:hypothetical protein EV715DRAFT_294740 [Schizophyllum commune]
MHDEYNSWIGLGSALMTLYGQTRLRSARFPVICITRYLVEAAILHITIPAMFTLVVASRGRSQEASIIPAYPNAYDWIHLDDDTALVLHTLFSDASSLLPYVGDLQPENTIGLAKSTCFYLYGNFDIEDTTGTLQPNLTLSNKRGLPANMSLIGCDLYSYNHTVPVDVALGVIDESAVPALRSSSNWSIWQLLIWFLRDRSEVLDTVGRVENPTEDELRHAGLFAVQPRVHASDCQAFAMSKPSTPSGSYKWREDFGLQPVPLRSSTSDWEPSKSEMGEESGRR